MTDIFACTDGTLRNLANADKSLSDFQLGSDLFAMGMYTKELLAMMSEHLPANIQPEGDVPIFELHFHIDLYPIFEKRSKKINRFFFSHTRHHCMQI